MSNTTSSNPASLRIANLLDEGSFVEIGGQVTARATDFNMQEKKAPTDGVITGYGVIDGNLVYVYSQDASVLNGTIGEMHAKKIANIYDMAMKMGTAISIACSSSQQGRSRATRFFSRRFPIRPHPILPTPSCIPFFLVFEMHSRITARRIQTIPPFPSAVIFGIQKSRKEQEKRFCISCRI